MKVIKKNGIDYYAYDNLEDAQNELLNLLSIIDDICYENHLNYWIEDGSLIGCVRHKSFIPWDDDLDIALLKSDYIKLIDLLSKYAQNNNNVALIYNSGTGVKHCCNYFASTRFWGLQGNGLIPLKIDIKPFNVIKNDLVTKEDNIRKRRFANSVIFDKEFKARLSKSEISQFLDSYMYDYGINDLSNDCLLSPPYFDYSLEEPLNYSDIFPLKHSPFGSGKVPIPNGYDKILHSMYGDYMKLPSLKNRKPCYKAVYDTKITGEDLVVVTKSIFEENEVAIMNTWRVYFKYFGISLIVKLLKFRIVLLFAKFLRK